MHSDNALSRLPFASISRLNETFPNEGRESSDRETRARGLFENFIFNSFFAGRSDVGRRGAQPLVRGRRRRDGGEMRNCKR